LIKTKHFKAKIVKNTIINFETKPSIGTMLNYRKEGTNSKIVTELIELINDLKKEETVKTIKLRSFLLNDKLSDPIKKALKNNFDIKCNFIKANFWIDKFAFFATSLMLMNFKNMRRIGKKTCLCIINL
jgi:hypothetical protein